MTRRCLGALLLTTLLLAVAGCTGTGDGDLVEGDGYRGVVLDAHLDYLQPATGPGIDTGVRSFAPSDADVERFEAALPGATPADLHGYVRQYTGVEAHGQRQLVAQGLCASAVDDDGIDWRHGWVTVADGGTCFWDATMDLRSGTILRFGFHGAG